MWLLAAVALAQAGVTYTRAPLPVEAGALGEPPLSTAKGAYRDWLLRAVGRAVPKAVDAALAREAASVEACLRGKGAGGPLTAEVTLALRSDGTASVKAEKDAEATLAGCVAETFDGKRLSVPLGGAVRLTYTVGWTADGTAAAPAAAGGAAADAAAGGAAADAAAGGAAAAAPSRTAFSPAVDRETGYGDAYFGLKPADLEGLAQTSSLDGSTIHQRAADYQTSWFGADVGLARYAFGSAGLYAVTVAVSGVETTWKLREAFAARYGPSRWDNRFGVHYWRGERVLLEMRPIPGSAAATITIVDMPKAIASGLADDFPGTPVDPGNPAGDRRLPRIFRD